MRTERRKATWGGLLATLALASLIVLGSNQLDHFDVALLGYTFATLFAAFGITYRWVMWLQRPPTAMYWRRGGQLLLRRRRIRPSWSPPASASSHRFRRQSLHLAARPAARGRALAHHVGLRQRLRHHLSAGLRLDSLRDGPRRSDALPRPRFRLSRGRVRHRTRCSASSSFTVSFGPPFW